MSNVLMFFQVGILVHIVVRLLGNVMKWRAMKDQ